MRKDELSEQEQENINLEIFNLSIVLENAIHQRNLYRKQEARIKELEAQVQALTQRTAPVFNFVTN